tara:strand:- start:5446 stop:5697 length:252 start_codon:yes stop_codon:yes gene_type:complete
MLKEGQKVKLKGKSNYGHNVLNVHGYTWTITGYQFCANMHHYFIESENKTVASGGIWRDTMYDVKDGRWLREVDEDFEIEEII